MIHLFIHDTTTGRVLGTGSYDERGDGAAGRAIRAGQINPLTQYAPGGVITARPTFNLELLTIDKTGILANAVDSATVSGIPADTVVKVFKDQDAVPRGVATVNDGTLVLRVDTVGVYTIELENFPIQATRFQVSAT